MSLISLAKAFMTIWPFIKEMFFADKSLKQIILENKFVVLLLAILFVSILLNYLSFSKIYQLAVARREDDGSVHAHQDKSRENPIPTLPKKPNKNASSPDAAASHLRDHHDYVRDRLDQIYGDN